MWVVMIGFFVLVVVGVVFGFIFVFVVLWVKVIDVICF